MTGLPVIPARWPAPDRVQAFTTTRAGGVSRGLFGRGPATPEDGLNLGGHVGDDPQAVEANRARLQAALPGAPRWMRQVHGTRVVEWTAEAAPAGAVDADACFTRMPGVVCAVLTADCLPVFFCDAEGSTVGLAHAGWRGLAAGILEQTLSAMRGGAPASRRWLAWLGPAIGPDAFEVGEDVRQAFLAHDARAAPCFRPGNPGKWYADLYALARLRLAAAGIDSVHGGGFCTVTDEARFYSHRRATSRGEATSGRMASVIWLQPR